MSLLSRAQLRQWSALVPEARQRFEVATGWKVPFPAPSNGAGKAGQKKGGPAAVPVTAATVAEADMPVILSAPGTVEPLANVAVKPRVDGQIVEVALQGRRSRRARAASCSGSTTGWSRRRSRQAEANIASDQASLRDAEATLARREALIAKKIVTEAALDQARFAVEGLKASIAAGKALLEVAEDPARLPHHPRADHRPHRQPDGQARRQRARRRCHRRWSPSTRPSRSWSAFALPQSDLGGAARRARPARRRGRDHGARRREADRGAGHDLPSSTTRSTSTTGTIDGQGDGRERRRGAVARPVASRSR